MAIWLPNIFRVFPTMTNQTIYSKTPKGLTELARKKSDFPENAHRILSLIDGKSNLGEILGKVEDVSMEELQPLLNHLLTQGLIKPLLVANDDNDDFPSDTVHISVTEYDVEEGVLAWAEAQRCAKALNESGFYAICERQVMPGMAPQALVIEDTKSTVVLEMALLEKEGFTSRHAPDGKTAWEILETTIPDLVILDVNLPDTNGLRILETLRKHPRLKDIPVIMVTAMFGEEDVIAGIRAGADGYIFKPFQQNALIDCVRRVLKHNTGAAQVKRQDAD